MTAMACAACDRLERGRAGRDHDFLASLSESSIFLADEQTYRGYCLVFLAGHAERLEEIPIERQVRLWEDVARLATALRAELAPARINFACLGNFMAHVHWHVIPRYADDPEPLHPIWVRPLAERRLELPASERDDLIGRLRRRLA
jgi:diadenosine tetraphosphate (Ap4A) HIT family hydrolase